GSAVQHFGCECPDERFVPARPAPGSGPTPVIAAPRLPGLALPAAVPGTTAATVPPAHFAPAGPIALDELHSAPKPWPGSHWPGPAPVRLRPPVPAIVFAPVTADDWPSTAALLHPAPAADRASPATASH